MALDKSGAEYEKYKEDQKKLSREASLKEIEEDIKKLKNWNRNSEPFKMNNWMSTPTPNLTFNILTFTFSLFLID